MSGNPAPKTIRQLIREVNQRNDPDEIRILFDRIMCDGIRFNGQQVKFTYFEAQQLFQSADPSIDEERFEEMAQIADAASTR